MLQTGDTAHVGVREVGTAHIVAGQIRIDQQGAMHVAVIERGIR